MVHISFFSGIEPWNIHSAKPHFRITGATDESFHQQFKIIVIRITIDFLDKQICLLFQSLFRFLWVKNKLLTVKQQGSIMNTSVRSEVFSLYKKLIKKRVICVNYVICTKYTRNVYTNVSWCDTIEAELPNLILLYSCIFIVSMIA